MAPQEPQYELRDSNGTLRGVVYINANDNVVVHHPTNGKELILDESGNLTVDGSQVVTGGGSNVLSTYLSTTQNGVNSGAYGNIFQNVEVNTGPFTVDSNSQVSVDEDGEYTFSWSVGFHQSGGGSRSIMQAYPVINGTSRTNFKGICYIRNSGGGDHNSTDGDATFSLNAGQTIRLYVDLHNGDNNTHDLQYAHANITPA